VECWYLTYTYRKHYVYRSEWSLKIKKPLLKRFISKHPKKSVLINVLMWHALPRKKHHWAAWKCIDDIADTGRVILAIQWRCVLYTLSTEAVYNNISGHHHIATEAVFWSPFRCSYISYLERVSDVMMWCDVMWCDSRRGGSSEAAGREAEAGQRRRVAQSDYWPVRKTQHITRGKSLLFTGMWFVATAISYEAPVSLCLKSTRELMSELGVVDVFFGE